MPELPEVEVNARRLAEWTRGRVIVEFDPPDGTRQTGGVPGTTLAAKLRGRRLVDVGRRGKWILARLDDGAGLALHLGMTGKIGRLVDPQAPLLRSTRAVFHLDDGTRVVFVDARRFGRILFAPSYDELLRRREIAELGPDALQGLTPRHLAEALAATRRTVKETLMDQAVVAGVGNLYATEALWRAGIHPATPAHRVAADPARVRALHKAIREALRHGLSSYRHEELPTYVEEGGENPFFVYGKAGEPCPRCGTKIRAFTLGGRTTAYCPTCQRKS